jgi:hypothetical protein
VGADCRDRWNYHRNAEEKPGEPSVECTSRIETCCFTRFQIRCREWQYGITPISSIATSGIEYPVTGEISKWPKASAIPAFDIRIAPFYIISSTTLK